MPRDDLSGCGAVAKNSDIPDPVPGNTHILAWIGLHCQQSRHCASESVGIYSSRALISTLSMDSQGVDGIDVGFGEELTFSGRDGGQLVA